MRSARVEVQWRGLCVDLHPRWEAGSEQKTNGIRTSENAEGVDTGDADVEEQLREKVFIAYEDICESILKMEWEAGLPSRESEAIADSVGARTSRGLLIEHAKIDGARPNPEL